MHAGGEDLPTLRQDTLASNVLLVAPDIEARSAATAQDLHRLFPNIVDPESAPDAGTRATGQKDVKMAQMGAGAAEGIGGHPEVMDVKGEKLSQPIVS